jgi:dipeptidase D
MNAIPREADALIHVASGNVERLAAKVKEWTELLKNELRASDPDVVVTLEKADINVSKVFTAASAKNAIAALVLIPSGVQTMSMDIDGLVESSTNLGVVTTSETGISFESAVRSCIRTLKLNIVNQQKMIAALMGAEFNFTADYPEWQYDPESKLRPVFEKVYKDMYGKDPEIVAIHAGVECGLFSEKMPYLDMISLGPDMFDVHTPNEHISISSVERTWNYLLNVLKEIK